MKLSAILAPMLAAKADHALIEQVIIAYEAQQTDALERRREHERQRQARKRDKSRDVTGLPRDRSLTGASVTRVEDKTSNSENLQKESKRAARGTRLPADFVPDIGFAISEGMPEARARTEAASFVDFWRAKAGAGGVKLDWPATWRVWVRKSMERLPARAGPVPPRVNPTLAAAFRLKDQLDAVTPSEIEGHHPPPRLVAIGSGSR